MRVIKNQYHTLRLPGAEILEQHCATNDNCCSDTAVDPVCSGVTFPQRLFLTVSGATTWNDRAAFIVSDESSPPSDYRLALLRYLSCWPNATYPLSLKRNDSGIMWYGLSNAVTPFQTGTWSSSDIFGTISTVTDMIPLDLDNGTVPGWSGFSSRTKPFFDAYDGSVDSLRGILAESVGSLMVPCDADQLFHTANSVSITSALNGSSGMLTERLADITSASACTLAGETGYTWFCMGQGGWKRSNMTLGQIKTYRQCVFAATCEWSAVHLELQNYIKRFYAETFSGTFITDVGPPEISNPYYQSISFPVQHGPWSSLSNFAAPLTLISSSVNPFYMKFQAKWYDPYIGMTYDDGYIEISE